jgi:hypothetical protein
MIGIEMVVSNPFLFTIMGLFVDGTRSDDAIGPPVITYV